MGIKGIGNPFGSFVPTSDSLTKSVKTAREGTPDNPIRWTYQGVTRTGRVTADWTDAESRYMVIQWDDGGEITIASRMVIPRFEEIEYV